MEQEMDSGHKKKKFSYPAVNHPILPVHVGLVDGRERNLLGGIGIQTHGTAHGHKGHFSVVHTIIVVEIGGDGQALLRRTVAGKVLDTRHRGQVHRMIVTVVLDSSAT